MPDFKIHDAESAPQSAQDTLAKVKDKYGFVPNTIGVMAESPPLVKAYATLSELFQQSSLSAQEQQVVILSISAANECHYCVAAHSMTADAADVPQEVIEAIRNDQPIEDEKLQALRKFAQRVIDSRGWAKDEEVEAFMDAGYTRANVLEVVLCAGWKTLSNYSNHIADTPVDETFSDWEWQNRQ